MGKQILGLAILVLALFAAAGCATDNKSKAYARRGVLADNVFTAFVKQENWNYGGRLVKYASPGVRLERSDDVVSLLPSERMERRDYIKWREQVEN